MTDQRDLKRRIRDRMAKTGESYTAARQHILAQRPPGEAAPGAETEPPFDVVEPVDLTAPAAAIGFKCLVFMFPGLAARIDTTAALRKLRDALLATEGDPSTALLRATVLRGELPPQRARSATGERHAELLRFVRRAQAGLGGVSEGGNMLALHVGSETVICAIATRRSPATGGEAEPLLWIHAVTESVGTLRVAGLMIR